MPNLKKTLFSKMLPLFQTEIGQTRSRTRENSQWHKVTVNRFLPNGKFHGVISSQATLPSLASKRCDHFGTFPSSRK